MCTDELLAQQDKPLWGVTCDVLTSHSEGEGWGEGLCRDTLSHFMLYALVCAAAEITVMPSFTMRKE